MPKTWIDEKDEKGETPLIIAVKAEDLEAAETLLKNGANVNAKDSDKNSPLHWAVTTCNLKMMELLINEGANLKDSNRQRESILHKRVPLKKNQKLRFPAKVEWTSSNSGYVCFFAKHMKWEIIELLLKHQYPINEKCEYCGEGSLLRAAVLYENEEMVKTLIEKDVNLHVKFNDKKTILHEAVRLKNQAILKIISAALTEAPKKKGKHRTLVNPDPSYILPASKIEEKKVTFETDKNKEPKSLNSETIKKKESTSSETSEEKEFRVAL